VSIKDKHTNKQIDTQANKQVVGPEQKTKKIGINYFFVSLCRHTQTMARSCLDTKLNYFFFLICCFQKLLNGGIKVKDYFQFKDV
jgi:hypothetical protein